MDYSLEAMGRQLGCRGTRRCRAAQLCHPRDPWLASACGQGKKLRLDDTACFKAEMFQVFRAYHPLPGGHVLGE